MEPYRRKVFYYETDNMGIVHHSNYIRWMEEARFDLVEKLGCSYSDMEDAGIIMPVTFVNCKYIAPCRYDDVIAVTPKVTLFNGIRLNLSYEILNETLGKICVRGESGHCFLNNVSRIPMNLKKEYVDFYEKVKAFQEDGNESL